jgi:hypothetical protein
MAISSWPLCLGKEERNSVTPKKIKSQKKLHMYLPMKEKLSVLAIILVKNSKWKGF